MFMFSCEPAGRFRLVVHLAWRISPVMGFYKGPERRHGQAAGAELAAVGYSWGCQCLVRCEMVSHPKEFGKLMCRCPPGERARLAVVGAAHDIGSWVRL